MRRWLALLAVLLVVPVWAFATGTLTVPHTIFTQPGFTNVAPLLDQNFSALANYINLREVTVGLLSARPVAGTAGRYYFSTDINGGTMYLDTGAAWIQAGASVNVNIAQQKTGLTLANNGTATATFTVAAGAATSDDSLIGNRILIVHAASATKSLAAWAVGVGGCLDTGTVTVFTWYSVFLIQRLDTGVVDVLCSASATAPTMPSNYTKKRRIGSIRTTWFPTAGAEIYRFSQVGPRFRWATSTSTLDVNTATSGVAAATATISTPNGVTTLALINVLCGNTAACYLSELTASDELPAFGTAPQGSVGIAGGGNVVGQVQVMTDTASSIRRRSSADTDIRINTIGWTEMFE